jgi:hypothetical protein
MATKTPNESCSTSCGHDCVTKFLGRFGICRSMLVTFALLPFAWDGVVWFVDAVEKVFDLVTGVGG